MKMIIAFLYDFYLFSSLRLLRHPYPRSSTHHAAPNHHQSRHIPRPLTITAILNASHHYHYHKKFDPQAPVIQFAITA